VNEKEEKKSLEEMMSPTLCTHRNELKWTTEIDFYIYFKVEEGLFFSLGTGLDRKGSI